MTTTTTKTMAMMTRSGATSTEKLCDDDFSSNSNIPVVVHDENVVDDDDDDDDSFMTPLTTIRPHDHYGRQQEADDDEDDDDDDYWTLLPDTFSFLMIAEYPEEYFHFIFKWCCWIFVCCCQKRSWVFCRSSISSSSSSSKPPPSSSDREEGNDFQGQKQGGGERNTATPTATTTTTTTANNNNNNNNKEDYNDGNRDKQNHQKHLNRHDPDYGYFPFLVGSFVFGSQMFIYLVVMLDLLSNKEIPPNVDRWLRMAQLFAVLVTIYTQSDLIDAAYLLNEGADKFDDIIGNKRWKFHISVFFRVLSGATGVVANFILIIYSKEVVELLLNFTAMEFVATLDNVAFELASKGFLGTNLAKKAASVSGYRYIPNTNNISGLKSRHCWYTAGVVLVFAAYGVVWGLQTSRILGDNEVYVQFDDTGNPELFGISGVYHGCDIGQTTYIGPVLYIPISNECPRRRRYPAGAFLYCWKRGEWIYSRTPYAPSSIFASVMPGSPCHPDEQPFLRSINDFEERDSSDAYDLINHADAKWIVRRPSEFGGEVILDNVFIHDTEEFQNIFDNDECGTSLESHGVGNETRLFSSLEIDGQVINGGFEYYIGDYHHDIDYYVDYGLMYRPIFSRPLPEQNGKFQVIIYYGLRWLYLDLDPFAFETWLARRCTIHNERRGCPDPTESACSHQEDNGGGGGGNNCWYTFAHYFLSNDDWLYNKTIANVTAISDPMILVTASDHGFPTSELKWYRSQVKTERGGSLNYLQPGLKHLQPGRSLPDLTATQNSTSYFFQCRNRVETNCTDGYTGISLLMTTDAFPRDTALLTFLSEGLDDYNSSSVNVTLYRPGHNRLPDLVDDGNNVSQLIRFDEYEERYEFTTCAPTDACVQLLVLDNHGDGLVSPGKYEFYYNDTLKVSYYPDDVQPAQWSCRSYQLGHCTNVTRLSCDFKFDNFGNLLIWKN